MSSNDEESFPRQPL